MNFKLLIFFELLVFDITVIVCFEDVESTSLYFQSTTDRAEVERAVNSYVQFRKTFVGKVITSLSKIKRNICSSSRNVKEAFCAEIAQLDYYGFKVDNTYFDSDCVQEKFWVKYITVAETSVYKPSTFVCPTFYYNDLVTNEEKVLPYYILISRAREHDSAFVFLRRMLASDRVLHPLQQVKKIAFKKLADARPGPPKAAAEKIKIITYQTVEARMIKYLTSKRTRKPYQKFVTMFFSLNVCALRWSHQVYLCTSNLEDYFKQERHYVSRNNEETCKKRQILFHFKTKENLERTRNHLHVIRCPRQSTRIPEEGTDLNLYYLSSNMEDKSLTVLSKHNIRGEKLQSRSNVDYLNLHRMLQDVRRSKLMPYITPKTRRKTTPTKEPYAVEEKNINSGAGYYVQMPKTIARNNQQMIFQETVNGIKRTPMKRDWPLVEDLLISFSKIKKSKFIYDKFRKMHFAIDICQLSAIQKREFCNDIFSTGEYIVHEKPQDVNADYSCVRQRITFTTRDTDELATDWFPMWQCPLREFTRDQLYYIGKSHLKDTAFVYKAVDDSTIFFESNFVYPYGYAITINRRLLAADYFVHVREKVFSN